MHRMQRDHCCSRDRITCRRAFAVVGGVLAIPTWEWATVTARMREVTAAARAERLEHSEATTEEDEETVESESVTSAALENPMSLYKRPTDSLLERLVARLRRTPRRLSEADAAHLLEAVAVIIYNPDTAQLDESLPPVGSGLRWDEFITTVAETYDLRFEPGH